MQEKHLIYTCLETILYAERKWLEMLNPNAKEFYLPTDNENGKNRKCERTTTNQRPTELENTNTAVKDQEQVPKQTRTND